MRRSAVARASVVLVAVVVASGCGADGSDDVGTGALDEATAVDRDGERDASDGASQPVETDTAATAADAASASEVDDAAVTAADDGSALLEEAIAAADDPGTAVRTRIESISDGPGGELRVLSEGVHRGDSSQMTLQYSGPAAANRGETDVEVILHDGAVYQRLPNLTASLGLDQRWLAFDLETALADGGDVVDRVVSAHPVHALGPLQGADRVTIVGSESLDGVSTTRLEVAVPRAAALELPEAGGGGTSSDGVDADGVVVFDVWVDDGSRLRRHETQVELDGITTTIVYEVVEYGADVSITAPPAEDTADSQTVFEQLQL